MRILFLTQTYPRFDEDTSGPFIRDLARGLVGHGDEVTVLTPHAEGVKRGWDDGGVEVLSFRYAPESWEVLGYSRSLSADETVRLGAGLVTPLFLGAAMAASRRLVSRRRFDLLHAHWVVPNGLVGALMARTVPLAIGLHGSDVFMAEKPLVRATVGRALAQASLLTGCSPELVDRVCALGFPRDRSEVIPYGVDVQSFSPGSIAEDSWRRRLGIPPGALVMLSVGRMVTKKGYHVLLDALPELLAAHPDAHVILAGSGDRLDEFRARVTPLTNRVHLPGIVMRDTLPSLYRESDIFVLPAVHDRKGNVDGLPNVILEAMATGLPIVASGVSGIPLAVTDGDNGLLVQEQDQAALGRALDALLTDTEQRRRMGKSSRERAVREHTWEVISGRYRAAYLRHVPGLSDRRRDSG
ncbi:MAG: glycosyltransferase [Acidobacteriota bacterium]|nr:glycosyltransferase [Acidobacteriota bacterium]